MSFRLRKRRTLQPSEEHFGLAIKTASLFAAEYCLKSFAWSGKTNERGSISLSASCARRSRSLMSEENVSFRARPSLPGHRLMITFSGFCKSSSCKRSSDDRGNHLTLHLSRLRVSTQPDFLAIIA